MTDRLARCYRWIDSEGVLPPVFAPENVEQARDWLAGRNRRNRKVLIAGSGRHWFLGGTLDSPDDVLSLHKWDEIVDFSAADLTLTLQAGARVSQVEALLKNSNLFLPFLPLAAADSTLGGIVSAGLEGPFAGGLGGVRDHLIGLETLHPEGILSHAGGKVVKNVAGYDLCKLYTGSMGSLGVLSSLTFKVRPLPPTALTLRMGFDDLQEALDQALAIRDAVSPAAIELTRRNTFPRLDASTGPERYRLDLGLLETPALLEWKISRIGSISATSFRQEDGIAFWSRQAEEFRSRLESEEELVVLLISSPLRRLNQLIVSLDEVFQVEGISASFLRGRIYALVAASAIGMRISRFREKWDPLSVSTVLWKASSRIKCGIDVWGRSKPESEIQSAMKRKLDPNSVLNPGILDLPRPAA